MNKQELYWLAGILEGEGYFTYRDGATISLQMTDRDIVERAALLLGSKSIIETMARSTGWKDTFHCRVHGQEAIDIMLKLMPIMGSRRQQKIQFIIDKHNNRTNTWSNKRKLTDSQIREIKESLSVEKVSTLALRYAVNRQVISDIKRGKTGKHV